MTDTTRRWRIRVIGAGAVVALAIGGVVLAMKATGGGEVREIRLAVRDMSYVAENGDANPTIRLMRGERVRLILTNDDRGYTHNLVAPVLRVETPLLPHGRSQSIEFVVPDVAGIYPYECGPHSEMMRGNIAIE